MLTPTELEVEPRLITPVFLPLLPSLSDCMLIVFMLLLFGLEGGWHSLLLDGDTGWHLRTGDQIIQTGMVPHTDPYSFTRPQDPWFAWEWLADVVFAVSNRVAGLKGVVFLSGCILCLSALILFRYMMWRGAGLHIAVTLCVLIVDSARIHFLARPHIFTLLLVPVCLWLIELEIQRPRRQTWLLVPIAALWTNLHGGFLFLISTLLLFTAAAAVFRSAPLHRLTGLTAACTLATLFNPFGYRLYIHLAAYLQSSWIKDMVQEFQSPQFRSESIFKFEVLLFLGLSTVPALIRRRQLGSALLLLGWAHQALTSVRHIPIYAFSAGAPIATELTVLWDRWTSGRKKDSAWGALRDIFAGMRGTAQRSSLWLPFFMIGSYILTPSGAWPTDFPEAKFPVQLLAGHELTALSTPRRILSSDSWGGYLIYHSAGKHKVFMDGRSDFYGEALGKDYVCLRGACPQWSILADRYGIDTILIPIDWPLANALRKDEHWHFVAQDTVGVWFDRESGKAKSGS